MTHMMIIESWHVSFVLKRGISKIWCTLIPDCGMHSMYSKQFVPKRKYNLCTLTLGSPIFCYSSWSPFQTISYNEHMHTADCWRGKFAALHVHSGLLTKTGFVWSDCTTAVLHRVKNWHRYCWLLEASAWSKLNQDRESYAWCWLLINSSTSRPATQTVRSAERTFFNLVVMRLNTAHKASYRRVASAAC